MRLTATLSLLSCLLLVGCGDPLAVNEAHPHYRTGMDHREAGRHEQAVEAFELCLEQSPRSEKAHLQLAMIYEDHLSDAFLAAYHYRQFLDATEDATQKKLVEEWLTRTEKRLRDELNNRHPLTPPPDPIPIAPPTGVTPPSTASVPQPARPGQPRPSVAPTPTPQPPPPPPPAQSFTTYTVQSGDNLSRIAKKTLGAESKWQLIYEANKDTLPSPGQLKIGQQLRIPKQ